MIDSALPAATGPVPVSVRFPAPAPGVRKHYLFPGDLFVSAEKVAIQTILATCVAVALWDLRGVGGLNHYLLPLWPKEGESSARFGQVALEQLLDGVLRAGAVRRDLRAKIFGGMRGKASLAHDLGARNCAVARRFLEEQRIPVLAEDVGGERSRRLSFTPFDGVALVSYF